jgi:hypothetical protein
MKNNYLKDFMSGLAQLQRLQAPDLWSYQLSGNVCELTTPFPIHREHERYRNAVIRIGRVVQALIHNLEKEGIEFHLQSFPNLENAKLVASIRITGGAAQNQSQPGEQMPFLSFEEAQQIARKHKLNLCEVSKSHIPKSEILDSQEYTWYGLHSRYNNPFTWLQCGYWLESINQHCTVLENSRFFPLEQPVKNPDKSAGGYIQAVFGVAGSTHGEFVTPGRQKTSIP